MPERILLNGGSVPRRIGATRVSFAAPGLIGELTLDVKAGDRVLFGKYAGTEVKLDDQDYLIMREDDILGVIERAAEHSKAKGKGR